MPQHKDPAELDGFLRFYYRGWRPTVLGRCTSRVWAWVVGYGLFPDYLVTLVMLAEIPPDQRAPILKAWCRIATSGRKHLPIAYDAPVSAFEAIAADYPVFRIDPSASAAAPYVFTAPRA